MSDVKGTKNVQESSLKALIVIWKFVIPSDCKLEHTETSSSSTRGKSAISRYKIFKVMKLLRNNDKILIIAVRNVWWSVDSVGETQQKLSISCLWYFCFFIETSSFQKLRLITWSCIISVSCGHNSAAFFLEQRLYENDSIQSKVIPILEFEIFVTTCMMRKKCVKFKIGIIWDWMAVFV